MYITPGNTALDVCSNLEHMRSKNSNKYINAHLNIKSIRNKFSFSADIVHYNVNIWIISELDYSFPDCQFLIEGFGKPFCLDQKRNGGGIMLFSRSDSPAKFISSDDNPFQMFYVELHFRKTNSYWNVFTNQNIAI